MAKRSIRKFFSVYLILAAVLPTVLVATITAAVSIRMLRLAASETNTELSRLLTQQVHAYLTAPIEDLQTVRGMVEGPHSGDHDHRHINDLLQTLCDSHKYFMKIQIADSNGTVIETYPPAPDVMHADVSRQDYFRKCRELNSVYWAPTQISAELSLPVTSVSLPWTNGVITGFLMLREVSELAQFARLEKGGFATVTDQNAAFIAHPQPGVVSSRTHDPFYNDFIMSYHGESIQKTIQQDNKEFLVYANMVPSAEWIVTVYQPTEVLYKPAWRLGGLIALATSLVMLVAILATIRLAGQMGKPFSRFISSIHTVAEGKYALEHSEEEFREFDELGRQFHQMVDKVQAREAEIREREANLRTTLNSIGDAVIVTGADGKIIRMNPVAEGLTGWKICEARNQPLERVFRIINGETREQVENPVVRVMQTGEIVGLANHTTLIARDGQEFQIADSGAPIKNEAGQVEGVVLVFRDVTEEYRIHDALSRSEAKFREIFNAGTDAILIHDAKTGAVVDVNQAMLDMYKCTINEAKQLSPHHFCANRPPYRVEDALNRIKEAAAGKPQLFEWMARRMDGGEFWCEVALRTSEIEGEPRVMAVVRDISQRKRNAELLREKEEQIRQTQKMDSIGQLAGGIAHDFNNMLGGIRGAAQLLEMRLNDDSHLRFVKIIDDAAVRAADLTQKLLAFSRKGKTLTAEIDLHDIVNEAIGLLERTIDPRIHLVRSFEATASVFNGDPSQMQNAILNLCINARDAMPEGGTLLLSSENVDLDDVYCEASRFDLEPGQYLALAIEDTGCGIDPKTMERIFEPFFTTKEVGQGTGLGLAAVYGTVAEHKGEICVKSEVGRRTSFILKLPVQNSRHILETPTEAEVVVGRGGILLVDDEEIVRHTGKAILEDLGYTVLTAEDGQVAIELFRDHGNEIDLVLLDLVMPRMNGRDAFIELQKIDPQVQVLVCSGYDRGQNVNELLDAGALGFIHKPYGRIELSQLVADACRQKHL